MIETGRWDASGYFFLYADVAEMAYSAVLETVFCRFKSCHQYQYGAVAQLGEHMLCTHKVVGSIPIGSTKYAKVSQW